MLKYCGNCGSQLIEGAKVCGNCGTPLSVYKTSNVAIPSIGYKNVKIKEKLKRWVVLAAFIMIIVIAGNIISSFTGYKGIVRKVMDSYINYDLDQIISMSSDVYYYMDDGSFVDNYFANIISDDLDSFENQLGHRYTLNYKIVDAYEMSKHKYEALLDNLSNYEEFDADIISEVMMVELDVIAKEGKDSMTVRLKLTLTKEDGNWRLLYIE